MRIAVLSDAHANHFGLSCCLEYLDRVESIDAIYFLGDAVGYYSEPNKVIDALKRSEATCLLGNHDAMALAQCNPDPANDDVYRIAATRDALTAENLEFLSGLSSSLACMIGTKRVLLVHGSPFNELEGYVYPDSDLEDFGALPYDTIFMGHTHHPFATVVNDRLIVNPGSCGLPRDHGALASFVVFDSELESQTDQVKILRLPLNVGEIANHFSSTVHTDVLQTLGREPDAWVGSLVNNA